MLSSRIDSRIVVGPREFLERMTVVPGLAGALEALFHRGAGRLPVVVAPGHPRLAGTMEGAVPAELVWALSRRGHPTLRFNYRGVGASAGEIDVPPVLDRVHDDGPLPWDTLAGAYADLTAAIEQHLETTGALECAVVGYSLGAAVAARAAAEHPAVIRTVLIAPPVGLLPFEVTAGVEAGCVVSVIAGAEDTIAPLEDIERSFAARGSVLAIPGASHDFGHGLTALSTAALQLLSSADDDSL